MPTLRKEMKLNSACSWFLAGPPVVVDAVVVEVGTATVVVRVDVGSEVVDDDDTEVVVEGGTVVVNVVIVVCVVDVEGCDLWVDVLEVVSDVVESDKEVVLIEVDEVVDDVADEDEVSEDVVLEVEVVDDEVLSIVEEEEVAFPVLDEDSVLVDEELGSPVCVEFAPAVVAKVLEFPAGRSVGPSGSCGCVNWALLTNPLA
jgi:hypothetical protein